MGIKIAKIDKQLLSSSKDIYGVVGVFYVRLSCQAKYERGYSLLYVNISIRTNFSPSINYAVIYWKPK